MTDETIHWHAVEDCLPDADTTVLARFKPGSTGEPVWLASFDGACWRDNFTWDGLQVCIPVDRYHSVASNLQAIHHILEARRVELRHGTLSLVRASFSGFLALPAPGAASARHWSDVLKVPKDCSREDVKSAFRRLASQFHPDKPGGSHEAMTELNAAQEAALKEVFR